MSAWLNKPRPLWVHLIAAGALVGLGYKIGKR